MSCFSRKIRSAAMVVLALSPVVATASNPNNIFITEFMYDGRNGEFFELTNIGSVVVDLAGWSFTDEANVPGAMDLSPFQSLLPGESAIITEVNADAFRTTWNLAPTVKVLGDNTQNLGRNDYIRIYDNSATLVDVLRFGDQKVGDPRSRYFSNNIPRVLLGAVPDARFAQKSVVGDRFGTYEAGGDVANPGIYLDLGIIPPLPQRAGFFAWGTNDFAQLANGTTTPQSETSQFASAAVDFPVGNVSKVQTSQAASFAVVDGSLYGWGKENYGELGNGGAYTDSRSVPAVIAGFESGVTTISTSNGATYAIKNGAAFGWGLNDRGQLGDGSDNWKSTPVAVVGLDSGVTAVSAGSEHAVAIKDSAVFAWGKAGTLGNGTTAASLVPVPVTGLETGVTQISAGTGYTLAIQDGGVVAWGVGGDVMSGDVLIPVVVLGLESGVTDIAAGYYNALAVKDGQVYAWGKSEYLGLGFIFDSVITTPTMIPGLSNIVDVATIGAGGYALDAEGQLWAWGSDLPVGDNALRTTPVLIPAPEGYKFDYIDAGHGAGHFFANTVAIPEPASLVLLCGLTLGMFARRSCRS